MDKTWMSKFRLSKAYIDGVEAFFEFANLNIGKEIKKRCPCTQCLNTFVKSNSEIRYHLYKFGIDQKYVLWTYHGESKCQVDSAKAHASEDAFHDVDEDIPEDVAITKEMLQELREKFLGDPEKFQDLLCDADEPLYENCSYTKLSAVVKLFNLKAKSGWSDISFSRLLKLLGELLPHGHLLPSSMNEVKKLLAIYGMKYDKIDACPNDCILYRGKYKDEYVCPTCGTSRYKEKKEKTKNSRGVPAKVMWYFPPIPRFKRMFQSVETSKNLRWHATERVIDDKLRHPADSPAWQLVDLKWNKFGREKRNLRLALSADGVNPHGNLSSRYSCWPVLLIIYNLSPDLCMKRKYMMLTMLISGPKQPGNDIDVYLAPLIDDLVLLWDEGVEVFDAYEQLPFTLRAVLLWTINDFPAYGNLSGCTTRGYFACPICSKDTDSERLKHSKKNIFRAHRRLLSRNHPYRKLRKAYNGEQEFRTAPEPLTGEEILKEIATIVNSWGKKECVKRTATSTKMQGKSRKKPVNFVEPPASQTQRDDGNVANSSPLKWWKKKSEFFRLVYWKDLLVRHNLDVMHIEKNVCESIIGTLLNIPGKTKDGINSRLDLVEMGIREELSPQYREGRPYLPPACYTLSRVEKTRVCKILHELKVPKGYSSNFRSLVSMQDLKLYSLKSHDCHVLMQQILPVAIRSVLPKHVRVAIIRLCHFFNALCAKVVDPTKLVELQKDVVTTLCLLEQYFPPSFFDIMVHLTVHLVREVQLCGPVFLRWMYAFERNMVVLKGYVRNRYRPEGCIAENYVAEEAIEFLSEYFPDLNAVGVPPSDEETHDDMVLYGKPPTGGKINVMDSKSLEEAHHYVLQNTDEVQPYIRDHMDYIRKKNPRQLKRPTWLQELHNRTFCDWLKQKVYDERSEPCNNVSETLRWIALGPSPQVFHYETYVINGYRFSTKRCDALRVNQNSGVSIVATTMQVSSTKDKNPVLGDICYYGVIDEIWLLDYHDFHIPVFKCDWIDNKSGVKVDDMGFTLVDHSRVDHKSDRFILASQAKQVFYVNDEFDKKWSVVLSPPQKCYLDGEKDNDLYEGNSGEGFLTDAQPHDELFDSIDDTRSVYIREDCEGTWVDEAHAMDQ